jgi:hypothetical protein
VLQHLPLHLLQMLRMLSLLYCCKLWCRLLLLSYSNLFTLISTFNTLCILNLSSSSCSTLHLWQFCCTASQQA